LQIGDKGGAVLLPNGAALLGAVAIDRALDVKQGVNAPDRLQRQLRWTPIVRQPEPLLKV